MNNVVALGYASIDYPAVLDGFFVGDKTVMIKQRPYDNFPRPGGSPLYVARPMINSANDISLITWLGNDQHGRLFLKCADDALINTTGIETFSDGNTPICFLIYQDDGSCGCCFDPGMLGREYLSERQKSLLRNADLLVVTVGPSSIAEQALKLIPATCDVAWVAKNDPISYPKTLRMQLGARCKYIFCNTRERTWIDDAIENQPVTARIIVETNGASEVKIESAGQANYVDVPKLEFHDPCGAGDTLAGGCLGAIIRGSDSLSEIACAGINAATQLLRTRAITNQTQ